MTRSPLLQRYFNAGHVIGKPVPLFAKIEQVTLDELKSKYGGQQQQSKPTTVTAPTVVTEQLNTREQLVTAIAEQGEKVRLLKASGADKSTWKPAVDQLLKLKKLLEGFVGDTATTTAAVSSEAAVAKAVAEQGEKVRLLKASGVDKSTLKPEIDTLLQLKKQLAELTTTPAASEPQALTRDEVEKAVAKQADKVRQLKASGVAKAALKADIDLLLTLKKQLEALGSK